MGFRFRKRVKIAPGLALNLSKSGPSLSIGGHGATMNIGRRGARATLGIPGSGLSWTFKCGAFTTPKANQAATAIQSMLRQMQKVAKRIAKHEVLSTYWKKAIIEQAQLLDQIMEIARASEDKRLIKVARDLLHACSDGAPEMRAALKSGATMTQFIERLFAEEQLTRRRTEPEKSLDQPAATTTTDISQSAVDNRPPELLPAERTDQQRQEQRQAAIAADNRFYGKLLLGLLILLVVVGLIVSDARRKKAIPAAQSVTSVQAAPASPTPTLTPAPTPP
jgi:hypothetical protein